MASHHCKMHLRHCKTASHHCKTLLQHCFMSLQWCGAQLHGYSAGSFGGYGVSVASSSSAGIPHLFPFRAEGCRACRGNVKFACQADSQAVSPCGARQKPRIVDDTALVGSAYVPSSRHSSCKHGSALDFRDSCGKVGRRQFFLKEFR